MSDVAPSADHNQLIILPERLTLLHRAMLEQKEVVSFRRGILFTHPDAVRDLLIGCDAKVIKSKALRLARWTLGSGLLTSDGALHRRQRPIIQPTLHPKRLAGYAASMVSHAAATAKSWSEGQTIDARAEMTRLTLCIVAEALFGAALGPEVDAISNAMDYNILAFARLVRPFGRLLSFIPTPFTFRYLYSRRKLLNVLRRFVANRRASGEVKDDLLGRLISAKTPDGQPAMSEQQLIDECVTLFAAGHETTANALTFTLWLLALHPQVQQQLAAEVQSVLPDSAAEPTIDDVDRLPLTRRILAESMRLYPPAWIQGREAAEELLIAGTTVKKGQTIFVSQWLTHRDSRWWLDPEKFDPERFNDAAAALAADGSPRPRWAYFPFGGGSRSCIGEAFAWTEMILVLATLARRWQFSTAPNALAIRLEPGITLRPGNAVELVVQLR